MYIESVMPSCHLILCNSLLFLPSIFPSITVFSSESVPRIRRPRYGSFSLSISPCNEHTALVYFRIDWFDHLAVPGTLKSPLQHPNSKASILWHSAFFMVQLSYLYWKNNSFDYMDLCRQNNVSLFNMLSRLVITFLPRGKHLLISGCSHHLQWFWSP